MKFTVVWSRAAEDELIEIWLFTEDRSGTTVAAHEIDQRLGRDPENEGESRNGGRRILLLPPLGVTYEVIPEDRLVRVLHVMRFGKRDNT